MTRCKSYSDPDFTLTPILRVAVGAALLMVAKVLGHKDTRTTEIYSHLRDDPLKAMADRTAAKIAAAFDAGAGRLRSSAEVVKILEMRRRRGR